MPNAAKTLILIIAALAIHTARAADPEAGIDPDVSVTAAAEPHTPPPARDGAQLFATHCTMCHRPAELARPLQSAADPMAAKAEMAAFLARHGRSDAAADAAVIDYLANSAAP